jgi:hypothetical protein
MNDGTKLQINKSHIPSPTTTNFFLRSGLRGGFDDWPGWYDASIEAQMSRDHTNPVRSSDYLKNDISTGQTRVGGGQSYTNV